MNYIFKTNDGNTLRVYWNDLFKDDINKTWGVVDIMRVNDKHVNEENIKVRIGSEDRPYFNWKGNTIYMDTFYAMTPSELVEKLNNDENGISSEELCATLMKYGLSSLLITIPKKKLDRISFGDITLGFETSSNLDKPEDYQNVDYKFAPRYLHAPSDHYKLYLVPAKEEEYDLYAKETYYVTDLSSMLGKRLKGLEERLNGNDTYHLGLSVNPNWNGEPNVVSEVFNKYVNVA
jgi:hypothetical protein